jgi:hypothetical protein
LGIARDNHDSITALKVRKSALRPSRPNRDLGRQPDFMSETLVCEFQGPGLDINAQNASSESLVARSHRLGGSQPSASAEQESA